MELKILAKASKMKGVLDNEYTLFNNGDIEHVYDASIYPGQQDLTRIIKAERLNEDIKELLLNNSNEDDKDEVKRLLGL